MDVSEGKIGHKYLNYHQLPRKNLNDSSDDKLLQRCLHYALQGTVDRGSDTI